SRRILCARLLRLTGHHHVRMDRLIDVGRDPALLPEGALPPPRGRGSQNCRMADGITIGELPREERKVVTAVFADLVGSTSLGERFDPEDVREIVGRAVSRMVEVVEE